MMQLYMQIAIIIILCTFEHIHSTSLHIEVYLSPVSVQYNTNSNCP